MSMSRKKCCVPLCEDSEESQKTLHSFPNPKVNRELFNTWVFAIGGAIIGLEEDFIYKERRVCRSHFEEKYLCRNNRISNIATPTLNLPGFMKLTTSPLVGRRPLASLQPTPEPLPSTSSDLQYDFHIFDDEVKENIAPVPSTSNVMEVPSTSGLLDLPSTSGVLDSISIPDNVAMEISNNEDSSTLTKTKESNQDRTITIRKGVVEKGGYFKRKQVSTGIMRKAKTIAERDLYKQIKSLRSKLSKCRKSIKIKKASLQTAKRITSNPALLTTMEKLPITGKTLMLMQLKQVMKKDKGRRFTFTEKVTALAIFKQSPKSYRFLRQNLILPAPQTLLRLLSGTYIKPGINKRIFSQLKMAASKMKDEDKLCVLLFDEMSILPNLTYRETHDEVIGFVSDGSETKPEFADHAQVFMIRGLMHNYKQVLTYTFAQAATKSIELAAQIKKIIIELHEVGLDVVATVCDQGSNNRAAIKSLVDETRGIFLREQKEPKNNIIIINGKEVVPLFDPPHLMKCVRNNLLTKDLKCILNGTTCTASWDHIQDLYRANPGYKGIRLIPKLSANHVLPHKINKMKVKYATQVFSRTVASNMGYLADKNILPKECQETADILILFDNLFDSVNGSYTKNINSKPLLGPVKPHSTHKQFWLSAKKILQDMSFVNKNTGSREYVPTLKNWVWTLDGIIILLNNLKTNLDITSVWMRHLNQDPIENFFGAVRSQGCRNTNPTPDRFSSALTTLIINNMSSVHTPGANCEKDYCKNLELLMSPNEVDSKSAPVCILEEIPDVKIINLNEKSDPRILSPLEYVTGYFCRNVKKKIFKGCKICNKNMLASEPLEYIRYREYTGRQWLCSPTNELILCMSKVQDIINDILKKSLNKKCIKELIKTIVIIHVDFNFLQCPEHYEQIVEYLINSVSKFFIVNYCKNLNNILAGRREPDDEEDLFQNKAKQYYMKCYRRRNK